MSMIEQNPGILELMKAELDVCWDEINPVPMKNQV